MSHRIITILTTMAVVLHTTLGCCAHHAHACDVQCEVRSQVEKSTEAVCSHAHHHEHGSGHAPAKDCDDHEHGHDCDHGDCSFPLAKRSSDLESLLAFSMWCQALGDPTLTNVVVGLPTLNTPNETKLPVSMISAARAQLQVWRL